MTRVSPAASQTRFTKKALAFVLLGAACVAAALGFSLTSTPAAFADSDGYQAAAIAQADSAVQADESSTLTTQKYPSATVNPNSKPCDGSQNKGNYTKETKHFFLLKSYMEKFEEAGGGTLTLEKGTYYIPTCIHVPSNVTIIFKDGVKLQKTMTTGASKLKPNSSMFQIVSPSQSKKTGVLKGYNGSKNVKFIGKGNVIFDMAYKQPGVAIIMAHTQNMQFSGITFQNLGAHAFELDASKNVVIENCTFKNMKNPKKTCEAINLDIPDKKRNGFSCKWSSMDCTPSKDIIIRNCTFTNLVRGIGSHAFSKKNGKNVMLENIQILHNTFTKIKGYQGVVVPFNWKNTTIEGNTFVGKGKTAETFGIVAHSVQGIKIQDNQFRNFYGTILIRKGFDLLDKKIYDPADVKVSKAQKKMLAKNRYVKGTVKSPAACINLTSTYGLRGETIELEAVSK